MSDAVKWVLDSPRRLFVILVALIAAILVAGSAFGMIGSKPIPRPSTPAPSVAAAVPLADPYVSTAVQFVKLWTAPVPGVTVTAWESALDPLATDELRAGLKTVNLSNVPLAKQQGLPVVSFVGQTSCMVAVPLADGTAVLVTVVDQDARLLVSDVQPDSGDL